MLRDPVPWYQKKEARILVMNDKLEMLRQQVRAQSNVPIIILSGNGGVLTRRVSDRQLNTPPGKILVEQCICS